MIDGARCVADAPWLRPCGQVVQPVVCSNMLWLDESRADGAVDAGDCWWDADIFIAAS